eukprot:SAG11_NODE_2429_length_3371_cov_5.133863_1_plen_82_part_00
MELVVTTEDIAGAVTGCVLASQVRQRATSVIRTYRERTQLLISEGNPGRPLSLSNGVMPQNSSDFVMTLVLKIGPLTDETS